MEKQPNILIVDDETEICEMVSIFFRTKGFDTLVAHDALSALDLLKRNHVDLVLSDIRMPGGGGMHLLKEIKKKDPNHPRVILFTGYNSDGTTEEALKLGAVAVLPKPLKLKDLVEDIKKHLSIK